MRNRIKYSQNFLTDVNLVKGLIDKSSISSSDTVIEIGAGEGIVTEQLLKKAGKVIAFELDNNFFNKLTQKFQNEKSLELKLEDFLTSRLPSYPYKVFSNIPFNITSAIIKKLILDGDSSEDCYLIVQKEAAMKFIGKPTDTKNSQLSVILYPWFDFRVIYNFQPGDFFPKSNVDIVLLEIRKKTSALIDNKDKSIYEDFITYAFNQPKTNLTESLSKVMSIKSTNLKPSEINFDKWISLFELFLTQPYGKQILVRNSFSKQLKQQENLEKINRTRVDKNWREF